ncbi:MAG TPA: O-antigen ligase family protein [Pyrinomonadaceae bacterium]|nr:O-antigen ligase family protein [Pyrinomonadaceae bacterium]
MEQTSTYFGYQSSTLSREDLERSNHHPIRAIRWLFYTFIFSLCLETVGDGIGMIEPPTVVGGLLVLSVLLQPGLFLRWPPKAFWCFIVYIYFFVAMGLTEPKAFRPMFVHDATVLIQLTILAWLAFNIMRDRDTALRALMTLALACSFLGFLQITGMAHSTVEAKGSVMRAAVFGFHPNHLARILILGMLIFIGTLYARQKRSTAFTVFTAACLLMLGAVLLQTGSRGAILALGLALLTFALRKGSLKKKVLNIFGLMIMLVLLTVSALQSDVMRSRFEETIEDGDLARREKIYPTAWGMFQERPLIGWGPVTSVYELGMRLGHPEEEIKNPHNLILYGIVTTGLLGSFPLFLGIALATFTAWKARNGPHGMLPLSMVICVLAANMSGVWLFNKLHWLMMAYALASAYYGPAQPATSANTTQDLVTLDRPAAA